MFCVNCGNKINEHHKFCAFCGTPINVEYSTPGSISDTYRTDLNIEETRQSELKEIDNAISYFSAYQTTYDEYDSSAKSINELNRINAKLALIWSIILFSVSFLGLLRSTSYGYRVDYYMTQYLICALISGGLLTLFFLLNKRRRTMLKNAIENHCNSLTFLSNYYYNYKNCPVSIKYSNPSNLKVIKSLIETGSANTINEALKMLITISHKNIREDFPHIISEYLSSNSIVPPGTVTFYNENFFQKK